MMKLLVNLKDLISSPFYLCHAGEHPWPVCLDDVRILHDCPFKLERFACIFTWAEPLVQWLSTQPQLATFEHDGYPGGEVRLGASDATLMSCSYLRISSYILACSDGQWARACPFAGFLYLCLSASELRAKRGPHQGETPPSKP